MTKCFMGRREAPSPGHEREQHAGEGRRLLRGVGGVRCGQRDEGLADRGRTGRAGRCWERSTHQLGEGTCEVLRGCDHRLPSCAREETGPPPVLVLAQLLWSRGCHPGGQELGTMTHPSWEPPPEPGTVLRAEMPSSGFLPGWWSSRPPARPGPCCPAVWPREVPPDS